MANQQPHNFHHHNHTLSQRDLKCLICNATYSDLSHLLTHLASKGHLSKKNDLDKRSQKDMQAAHLLSQFNAWYTRFNVEALEQERMEQKDAKKAAREANKLKPKSLKKSKAASQRRRNASNARGSIDPQLDGFIKTEPDTRSTNNNMLAYALYGSSNMHQSGRHLMGAPTHMAWSPAPTGSVLDNTDTSSGGSAYGETEPSTASRRRRRATEVSTLSGDPTDRDMEPAFINGQLVMVPITRASNKLGIPGVHEFDCATPEGKRVRNQKKDGRVLKGLEASSRKSSPLEMVFKDNNLRATREITGHPDCAPLDTSGETEPEAGTPPPKKKRKNARKPRAPLAKKSKNTGMAVDRRDSHQDDSMELPQSASNFDSSDVDFQPYIVPSRPRQGGLRIHNDNSGPALTRNGNAMPSPMSNQMPILTSGLQQIAPSNDPFHNYGPYSYQYGGGRPFQNPMAAFSNNTHPPRASNGHTGQMLSNPNGHNGQVFNAHNGHNGQTLNNPYFSNMAMGNMGMGMGPAFGSFGQLNSRPVSNTFGHNNPLAFSLGPATHNNSNNNTNTNSMLSQSYNTDDSSFFQGPMTGMPSLNSFDSFSTNETDMLPDIGFNLNGTFNNTANNLFLPPTAAPDGDADDGATISLPPSER